MTTETNGTVLGTLTVASETGEGLERHEIVSDGRGGTFTRRVSSAQGDTITNDECTCDRMAERRAVRMLLMSVFDPEGPDH